MKCYFSEISFSRCDIDDINFKIAQRILEVILKT